MGQIVDYTTLSAAIAAWDERSVDADELIGLAEAEFRLYFGPNYAKETSAVLTFVSGSATLPGGFIRALSLVHATYGALTEKTIGVVRERRVFDQSGIPDIFAITGTTIEIGPAYNGDATVDFEGTLTGLTATNAANWLITNAPQAYLSMCLSMAKAKYEDFGNAALLKQNALATLDALGVQSVVGQIGRAAVNIPGMTP